MPALTRFKLLTVPVAESKFTAAFAAVPTYKKVAAPLTTAPVVCTGGANAEGIPATVQT